MKSFDYNRAGSIRSATRMLGREELALAGGTDLLPLLKDGLLQPKALVDIKHSELPAGVTADKDGITIGALTTISEIEHHQDLREQYPLLSEAAKLTATRQLRNRATLGGNLLQASRCWYFREPDLTCWLRGGTECYAKAGRHERHAIANSSSPCITVHPSDLAGCLVALDAVVQLTSDRGDREIRLSDFLTSPTEEHRQLHSLRDGELITAVRIRRAGPGSRSTYRKAMSRKAWSFALVGVATTLEMEEQKVTRSRTVLNGLAPVPLVLDDPAAGDPVAADALVSALVADLENSVSPLPRNGYKLPLARSLIAGAIDALTKQ